MAGKAEYEKNVKEHVMLEASDIDRVQQQPSPRLLNTHVPVSMLPRQVKDKKVKVIHVYRNVKDVCVSMYFHLKQRDPMPIEEFFEKRFLNFEGNENGNYFAYLKSMDEFIKANPDHPIFNVSFEEMKTDPVGTVTRLAEFLGVPHTPELCRQVADACTIDKMREADKSKDRSVLQKRKFGQGMNISMYRKGEVGDWKNHLTVAQSERLDALMKQLEGCDFRFRYTL
nr:hypothetical protein BaRGS_013118 [Batillaria attramentaria]